MTEKKNINYADELERLYILIDQLSKRIRKLEELNSNGWEGR